MTMVEFDRRAFLAASAASAALPLPAAAATGEILRPEQFGALGDGITDDTAAFARLSTEVNRRGGGTIVLAARRTYMVGQQVRDGGHGFTWTPSPIIALNGLTAPLTILGNGARLRARPGLRFGVFDPDSDQPLQRHIPNYNHSGLSSPYRAMIEVDGSTAPIAIRDVELDGSLDKLRIGGKFGDTGWQVPASGLVLQHNLSDELIANVVCHHHGQDGAILIGDRDRKGRTRVTRLNCRHNGRQGLSITSGRGFDFSDCEFSHTGRSVLHSAPSAGVDIECERGTLRDLSFSGCKFVDNSGCGLLADSGDSADAHFSDCLFVGTTTWAAWPKKPGFRFAGCTFAGAVVHPFPSADPALAARFTGCRFTDDPKLSPTGKLFLGGGPIVNMGESDNILFDRCRFDLVADGVLPWGWRATYRDCTMRQASPKKAETKGRYLGTTTISGPVDLYGSMVQGTLVLNGRTVPRGPVGGAPAW